MHWATVKLPDEITIEQVRAMLYIFENLTLADGATFDYLYEATSATVRARTDLFLDTLRDYGFEPAQIKSIRFRPHEVTLEVWEWDEHGKVFKRGVYPAALTVHMPVRQPGTPPRDIYSEVLIP